MAKIVMVFAFLLTLLGANSAPKCTPSDTTRWLADSLKEMETIRAGMTRQDLLKVFRPAGGISSPSKFKGVFVYRDSPYISVNVEFEHPKGGIGGDAQASPQDVIASVSRPCLEEPAFD
jgi:hypothetical protein